MEKDVTDSKKMLFVQMMLQLRVKAGYNINTVTAENIIDDEKGRYM